MSSELVKANAFTQGVDSVWGVASEARQFNYSDGAEAEQNLYRILSKVDDLSTQSQQLKEAISDWPSEYHLSPSRANLLRPLDFSKAKRVLELGCGCGSITRFLGEHAHLQVDAVEGSPSRASLAALRCRELANVTVSTANFNDLTLPESHYDLVLFVGVTEYAGRFSNEKTDEQALQALLSLAHKALVANGQVVIAIENRLGLKYLLGANEDHYARAYCGVQGYPEADGIRTYDRAEWLHQIAQSDFAACKFAYPFPDYKVPSCLVTEEADASHIDIALAGINSRDYTSDWMSIDKENKAWFGLAQRGQLAEFSNSFLIMLAKNQQALDSQLKESVYCYDDFIPSYLLKPSDQATVSRDSHEAQTRKLRAQIAQLEYHASNLESKVDLMSNSIGWRFLNAIRRLLGKTTL